MDWDLWDPPSVSVAEEADWQCNFYFGLGFDVMEENENVLNEKCCVHVLRILITKADSEIDKLEQDLVFLKSELAWIEKEEWSARCRNALTEKINYLEVSITSLRTKDENDIEVHLLMHTQPAERLHDILKALLQKEFDKKHEQQATVIILDSGPVSLKPVAGRSEEKKLSISLVTVNGEAGGHDMIPGEKIETQDSSSQSADKGSPKMEMSADIMVSDCNMYSIEDPWELTSGHSNEKKHSINSDSKIVSKENEDQSSISTSAANIGSTLEPAMKEADLCEKVLASSNEKPENSVFQELSLNVSQNAIDHFNKMKKLCKSDIKVNGLKEVRENHSRTASKSKIATSLFKPEGKGNSPRTEKGKCNESDTEQKLCDFTLKVLQKRIMKETKLAAVNDKKMEGKRKNALQVDKVGHAGLTDTENCALNTLIELHDNKGKTVSKQRPNEELKAMPKEVKASEIADEKEPKLNIYLNSQMKRAKRKSPPILQEIDFGTLTVPNSSSISNCKKHQNSGLNLLNDCVTCLLNGESEMKVVRPGERDCKAKKHGVTPDNRPKSVSQPQKKRKKSENFPASSKLEGSSIRLLFLDLFKTTAGGASKDDPSAAKTSSNSFSDFGVPVSLAPSMSDLKDLKVVDLRAIAKELKLSKYHKLGKKALLELLTSHAGNC